MLMHVLSLIDKQITLLIEYLIYVANFVIKELFTHLFKKIQMFMSLVILIVKSPNRL